MECFVCDADVFVFCDKAQAMDGLAAVICYLNAAIGLWFVIELPALAVILDQFADGCRQE